MTHVPSAAEFDQLVAEWLGEQPGADVLANAAMMNLYRTALWCEADFEAVVHRPAGLTFAGFRLLHCLWVVGPMLSGQLARLVSTTPATVSSVVNTLERHELVRRERSADDRRQVRVLLTDAGREQIAELLLRQNERERVWLQGVPRDDLQTFLRVLRLMGEGARRRRDDAALTSSADGTAPTPP